MISRRGFLGALFVAPFIPISKPSITWKSRLWASNYRPGAVPIGLSKVWYMDSLTGKWSEIESTYGR